MASRIEALVELAEEAIGYAPDYFREKWSLDERLAELAKDKPNEITVTLGRQTAERVLISPLAQGGLGRARREAVDEVRAQIRAALERSEDGGA